jgi:hypothetical protein
VNQELFSKVTGIVYFVSSEVWERVPQLIQLLSYEPAGLVLVPEIDGKPALSLIDFGEHLAKPIYLI